MFEIPALRGSGTWPGEPLLDVQHCTRCALMLGCEAHVNYPLPLSTPTNSRQWQKTTWRPCLVRPQTLGGYSRPLQDKLTGRFPYAFGYLVCSSEVIAPCLRIQPCATKYTPSFCKRKSMPVYRNPDPLAPKAINSYCHAPVMVMDLVLTSLIASWPDYGSQRA